MSDGANSLPTPAVGLELGGRYRLVKHMASGGMAQVWEATDQVLHRQVAAKILHPHLATDHAFLLRFRREAVAAARLSHRSIVAIFDTVSADGYEAIIMELVEGRTLREVLDDVGRLSVPDALDVGKQVAEALDEAHRNGVIHRDIKPSNILLCDDRRVMVTDFGIAKAGEDADLTVAGTLLGTAKYLAPEQVTGDEVDPRTDLYSLGIVLYESLTGVPPFRADTDAATALARLHQSAEPVANLNRAIPAELASVIGRLIERNPEDRYNAAMSTRTALSGVRETEPDASATVDPTLNDNAAWSAAVADPTTTLQAETTGDVGFIESERSWLVPALLVLFIGGAVLLAGALLMNSPLAKPAESDSGLQLPDAPESTTVLSNFENIGPPTIRSVRSFDPPPGDGAEQDQRLPFAVDDDLATFWRTERYTREDFGSLKEGVGIIVELEEKSVVGIVRIESPTLGWSADIYVAEDFTADRSTWGSLQASVTDHDGPAEFVLEDAIGSNILVWITDHGSTPPQPSEPADLEGPYNRMLISELEAE